MESLWPLWEIQRDAQGLPNARKGSRRKGAERGVDCQASQGKLLVLDPGNRDDADVKGKAIECVGGDYERGAFLVQGEQANVSSPWIPTRRLGAAPPHRLFPRERLYRRRLKGTPLRPIVLL